MGSSVLGLGLCSATDWGGGDSSCPPHLHGLGRGQPSTRLEAAVLAQQLLHREQQTGLGTTGQRVHPEPLETLARRSRRRAGLGRAGTGVVLVPGLGSPARRCRPPAPGGARPEVKVSVRAGAPGGGGSDSWTRTAASLQHGVQLVGQVVKHAADVI